eukprot:1872091-Alexandrium_andersonii.AAC.1
MVWVHLEPTIMMLECYGEGGGSAGAISIAILGQEDVEDPDFLNMVRASVRERVSVGVGCGGGVGSEWHSQWHCPRSGCLGGRFRSHAPIPSACAAMRPSSPAELS